MRDSRLRDVPRKTVQEIAQDFYRQYSLQEYWDAPYNYKETYEQIASCKSVEELKDINICSSWQKRPCQRCMGLYLDMLEFDAIDGSGIVQICHKCVDNISKEMK